MKKLTTLTICLLCTLAVFAKTYKVTSADEFKKVAAVVAPGDMIIIANGNYTGWELALTINGTEKKPVIIRAEKAGGVIFSSDVHKPIFQLTGSYVEISGLTFTGCNVFKATDGDGFLISDATEKNGAGLKNIRNRAALIGAVATIDSAPNKGCSIKVTLNPLTQYIYADANYPNSPG